MAKESEFWTENVRRLKAFGEIDRIEDAIKVGVSDCVYCLRWQQEPARFGWIELKRLLRWPVRASTCVWLPHYSLDQANYLVRWGRAGAGAFLLAQIANEFLLFPWAAANEVQEGCTRSRMYELVVCRGVNHFPHGRILRCLTTI